MAYLQVTGGDVKRVLGLSHVKDLILHILYTQLRVQPAVNPHLVDLAEEDVHICLQSTVKLSETHKRKGQLRH